MIASRVHTFEIIDLSLGGIGLRGAAALLAPGARVLVHVDADPLHLALVADVRHRRNDQLGLAWMIEDPCVFETLVYVLDSLRHSGAVPLPIVPERTARVVRHAV